PPRKWLSRSSRVHHVGGGARLQRWAAPGELHRRLDGRARLALKRPRLAVVEPPALRGHRMQTGDRIKSRPLGLGELVAVALLIAVVVPAPAVRQALQQIRSPAGARLPQVVAEG